MILKYIGWSIYLLLGLMVTAVILNQIEFETFSAERDHATNSEASGVRIGLPVSLSWPNEQATVRYRLESRFDIMTRIVTMATQTKTTEPDSENLKMKADGNTQHSKEQSRRRTVDEEL